MQKYKSKIKNKLKEVRFPNIFRSITDIAVFLRKKAQKEFKAHKNLFNGFLLIAITALLGLSVCIGVKSYKNYKVMEAVLGDRQKIIADVSYWKNIIEKHKGYRDGYFNLALLYYRLKDFQKAKENLDKSLELDPNFEKGRELEKFLISN